MRKIAELQTAGLLNLLILLEDSSKKSKPELQDEQDQRHCCWVSLKASRMKTPSMAGTSAQGKLWNLLSFFLGSAVKDKWH